MSSLTILRRRRRIGVLARSGTREPHPGARVLEALAQPGGWPTASRRELELKFELPPASVSDLERLPMLRALAGQAQQEKIVSVYFDTQKQKLRKNGIGLRQTAPGEVGSTKFLAPWRWARSSLREPSGL